MQGKDFLFSNCGRAGYMQTPLSTVSVEILPPLGLVSKLLRSDVESAGTVGVDCVSDRTRFRRCKKSFTFHFNLRLGFLLSACSTSELDDDEEVDDGEDVAVVRGKDTVVD